MRTRPYPATDANRPVPIRRLPSPNVKGIDAQIGIVLAFDVVFTLLDFATSSAALREGLREGNSLVLGLAGSLDTSTLAALAVLKVVFVAGAALVALVGVRAKDRGVKRLMLTSLLTSSVVFFAVSVSNLQWILH